MTHRVLDPRGRTIFVGTERACYSRLVTPCASDRWGYGVGWTTVHAPDRDGDVLGAHLDRLYLHACTVVPDPRADC